jgi:proteasome accessory factor C
MTAVRRGPRPANERLRRLLVMLPWLMERGTATVAELAERFQMAEAEVVRDLEKAAMCGVPPYGPDDLVDLFIDEDVVHAGPARFFTRPLRLTAPEGFALLAAGRAALQLPGASPDGPLARALAALATALGAEGLDVELTAGGRRPQFADELAAAADDGAQVRIRHWSPARDETSERVVDPLGVFADRGNWYLAAHDHASGEERTFRIDRIESLEPTGSRFTPRAGAGTLGTSAPVWFEGADLERATLRLSPGAGWIAERYPTDSVQALGDGWQEVVLPVSSERWLARVLLRAGREVEVVAPERWRSLAATTADALRQRYRSSR